MNIDRFFTLWHKHRLGSVLALIWVLLLVSYATYRIFDPEIFASTTSEYQYWVVAGILATLGVVFKFYRNK